MISPSCGKVSNYLAVVFHGVNDLQLHYVPKKSVHLFIFWITPSKLTDDFKNFRYVKSWEHLTPKQALKFAHLTGQL